MKHTLLLDANRCSGCMSCIVACMDQNDTDVLKDNLSWRWVFQIEAGNGSNNIEYLSSSCRHCEDAPCIKGCPTGALSIDPQTEAVLVTTESCIGCRSCVQACPFGVPRFGTDGKMQKCNLCFERISNNLEPACVRVCPTKALKFGNMTV